MARRRRPLAQAEIASMRGNLVLASRGTKLAMAEGPWRTQPRPHTGTPQTGATTMAAVDPKTRSLYQTIAAHWPAFSERMEEQGGLPSFDHKPIISRAVHLVPACAKAS